MECRDKTECAGDAKNLLICLKDNSISIILISVSLLFNVYMILFQVGVDKVGYAGFQNGTSLMDYYRGIKESLDSI